MKGKSRPQRWAEACDKAEAALSELLQLQDEYVEWAENIPENLEGSALHEKVWAMADPDVQGAIDVVEECRDSDLPRGFGRD